MIYEHTEGGIIVPKPPQKPPHRAYPPLEIQDEERREEVGRAMYALWDAMDLSKGRSILDHNKRTVFDAHYAAFQFLGEMILGSDCPGKEMNC